MKMKRFWVSGLLVVLLGIGWYFFWTGVPGQTPPGQAALVEITGTSLDSVKAEFNQASDSVRVIALLSPT